MYFNESKLPSPQNEYDCWVDIQGTSSIMLKSLSTVTNFVCKLHIAVHEAQESDLKYGDLKFYPMLDGLHITSRVQATLISYLKTIFSKVAEEFLKETNPQHRFIIKAAIAYGPIIHGDSIGSDANSVLAAESDYKKSLLFGMPIIQAYASEKKAPPFGIFIHESARSFSPTDEKPLPLIWFKWADEKMSGILMTKLREQYEWYKKHSNTQTYSSERIEFHLKMAEEYFAL